MTAAADTGAAIHRMLTLEVVRVTERAAIAAAGMRGRGDEQLAEQAAIAAMRRELDRLPIRGRIVIGETDGGDAGPLRVGATVGTGEGPEVDVACLALEGTTLCAKNLPNALTAIAIAGKDGLLRTPGIYMEKIAVGPGYPADIVDFEQPPGELLRRLAEIKGAEVGDLSACVLDRPRHAHLVEALRATGASVRLIPDGDVAAIIDTADPDLTGIDIYMGSGGAPEGVLAAAALRCMGGQMCARLICDSDDKVAQARKMGIDDPRRVYRTEEMASGDVIFSATGITACNTLEAIGFRAGRATTHSVVMRSRTGTQRWMRAVHRTAGPA